MSIVDISQNNVFLYWVGKEFKLIKILRDLIYLHSNNNKSYTVHLINHGNINNYLEDLPDCFYKLTPNHQSDYVRVNVIYKYGGIWLDSDTIVMNGLHDLFEILKKQDGFFIKEAEPHRICCGVFGSKANTELLKEWKIEVDNLLKMKKNIGWCDVGIKILINFKKNKSELFKNIKIFSGRQDLYPIFFKFCVTEFLEKPYENYKKIEKEFQPLIIIVNSVYRELEKLSKEEILNGNMPLNYFINKSLGVENKNICRISTTIINLKNINFYYLTCNNLIRKNHILEEFKDYNLHEVNPILKNEKQNISKYHSGASGFLRILDLASQHQDINKPFQPFVILEDDVKKYYDFSNEIEIPKDCDILYIGISKWGVTMQNVGIKDNLFFKNINENIIKIYNMLSGHGMLINSLRGMLTLQKCILEDFFKNRHYDISISQIQPYLNVYALKKPLVYQYKKIGGCELGTKFELTNKQDKHIPEELKNRTNISIQTLATI